METGAQLVTLVRELTARHTPRVLAVREQIHQHPEIAWQENTTLALVADELRALDLTPEYLTGGLSVTIAPDGYTGPYTLLRADVDALPVQETDHPGASTIPGTSHACGHDVHTAIGLATAANLAKLKSAGLLDTGTVVLFQRAEEVIPGGAEKAIHSGVLTGADRAFAFHCFPAYPPGTVALRPGLINYGVHTLTVTLTGAAAHTSRYGEGADLVDQTARAIHAAQDAVRGMDGISFAFGQVHGGTVPNATPESVTLQGTLRADSPERHKQAMRRVHQALREQLTCGWTIKAVGLPPVINSPEYTADIRTLAVHVLGKAAVHHADVSYGADDFAHYLTETVQIAYILLGVGGDGLHTPGFNPDLSGVPDAITLATLVALRYHP